MGIARRPLFWSVLLVWGSAVAATGQAPVAVRPTPRAVRPAATSAPTRTAPHPASYKPVLDRYCVGCHNARQKVAGLSLEAMSFDQMTANAATWEKVVRKLRTGVMPPIGMPGPDEATRWAMVGAFEQALDAAPRFAGTPAMHRLNRAEYANAVRDLLALDVDTAALLPPDEPAYGFDNIGEVLALSPSLLERYGAAAAEIATLAVGDAGDVVPGARVYRAPADLSQGSRNEGLPLGTSGGMLVTPNLPLDGEYVIRATLFTTNLGLIKGLEFEREVEFLVDGEKVFGVRIGGERDFDGMLQNQTKYADEVNARLQVRVQLKAGPRAIGVTFRGQNESLNTRRLQAMLRTTSDTSETLHGPPHISIISVAGPFQPTGPGDTPSRQQIFLCRPATPADEDACAQRIVARLARRGYRGTDTPADVQALTATYREERAAGGSFDAGVAAAVQRLLVSPRFLVRIERQPATAAAVYRVSDLELASRLSFFLWSSIPDDELVRLARAGRLHEPAVLEAQVRRMLGDRRAGALTRNFAGQWLQLRNLRSQVPDSREFPNFDDQLRQAFRRETELFVESIVREDRNVLELLTADYTYANERLARHYGIPGVYGDAFRRVTLPMPERRGLLGHGSILAVTSHVDRTSPVVRGKWVLDNLLGAAAPPPPPNVPPLTEQTDALRPRTMRQRMEQHRANPVCASCHRMMDPIGFALEHFDAVGAWRDRDGRASIDASGQFVDGSAIDGAASLRVAILKHPENFVTTLTEKLFIYGLGRGLDARDLPAVRAIVRSAAASDYRMSSIVLGIVNSRSFQMRSRGPLPASTLTQAAR